MADIPELEEENIPEVDEEDDEDIEEEEEGKEDKKDNEEKAISRSVTVNTMDISVSIESTDEKDSLDVLSKKAEYLIDKYAIKRNECDIQ